MFLLLAVIAAVAYSLQTTLLTTSYRTVGALATVSYRGLALGLSMAPLLLAVPASDFTQVLPLLPLIVGASALTLFGNWAGARVYLYLPVGVAAAITISFFAAATVAIGMVMLDEQLTLVQSIAAATMLVAVLLTGLTSPRESNAPFDFKRGVLFSVLFAITIGGAFVIIGWASRQVHPFLVGWLWELGAGVIGILALVLGRARTAVPAAELWKIFISSSPTVIGTACYTVAATQGPVGLVATLLTLEIPASSIMAAVIFHERLSKAQWALILVMTAAVAILKALQ
ncbi:MAG: DMT family transporter [Bdellovibrionota bacterium]